MKRRFDLLQYIHPYWWSCAIEDCVWFWRLPGSFCAFVQSYHLYRQEAHHGSLCHFKTFSKTEKKRCSFYSQKVEAGQVTKKAPLSSEVKTEMTPCLKMCISDVFILLKSLQSMHHKFIGLRIFHHRPGSKQFIL